MSLDKFSTELVQQVLYEVDLHIPDSREGLRHLSQCSNHYYQLVRPFLFSNLIQNHTHAVPLFLRSILANPSLACYTRKIESSASLAYKISPLSSHTVRAQLEIVIQTASGDDQPLAVKWMDDLFNDLDNYDATTAILFCLLPNLESIRIESYGLSGGYPYIQHVLKTAAQLQEHLEVAKGILRDTSSYSMAKLSMVSLYCHDMGIDNHSFEAMCFLRPRSVQRFSPYDR
ncbi:hypothetical protein HYFRA_00013964 [Hymenoscyphus fraxineus]|uniref:Uncharacterized protein n=1 Tax=Hymenoscyphus fraxineus TaxID=746836 RepID=A0A9N9LAK4_9HELO|nr:hypothetical protein HYFRA_00013964 [Hymenoscyphus fraxineus]